MGIHDDSPLRTGRITTSRRGAARDAAGGGVRGVRVVPGRGCGGAVLRDGGGDGGRAVAPGTSQLPAAAPGGGFLPRTLRRTGGVTVRAEPPMRGGTMSDEGFLRAILENPEDDTARLV